MENQLTKLDKAVKISIIAGALIVALSIAYYLVVFLPKKEKMILEQQKAVQQQEQQAKDDAVKQVDDAKAVSIKNLQDCLDKAGTNKNDEWNINCKIMKRDNDCPLPPATATFITDNYTKAKDTCLKEYPQQ